MGKIVGQTGLSSVDMAVSLEGKLLIKNSCPPLKKLTFRDGGIAEIYMINNEVL